GLVSVALVVIGLAQLITTMGVGPAIIQRAVLSETEKISSFYLSIALGFVTFLLLYCSSDAISSFFSLSEMGPILKVLSASFPIACIALVSESLMQSRLQFKGLAIRDVLSYLVGYVLIGLPLAYWGAGAWS